MTALDEWWTANLHECRSVLNQFGVWRCGECGRPEDDEDRDDWEDET